MDNVITFFAHRWYVFLLGLAFWVVMKYVGKNTKYAREADQVSATVQILFLIIYTVVTIWFMNSGASSQAFTAFTLLVNIGGVIFVLPLFLLILYRLSTAKFLDRLPNWGKNLVRLASFVILVILSYPALMVIVTLYYGW